jgi:hypothetical protein
MGYSNRMLNGLLNDDFYGLFTAFVPTFTDFLRCLCQLLQSFTDFYQVYRLLSSFLTFKMFFGIVHIY